MITQKELQHALHYDPETGVFLWPHPRSGVRHGHVAGWLKKGEKGGYKLVCLYRRRYYLHKLAWLWVTGKWPSGQIDHINGVRDDNRFSNLRDVPDIVNRQNLRAAKRNNRTGLLGVHINRDKFFARITVNKKIIHLGTYSDAMEAHKAYVAAKRRLHEGCTI